MNVDQENPKQDVAKQDTPKMSADLNAARDIGKQVSILRTKLLSAVSEIIGHSIILVDMAKEISSAESAVHELLDDLVKNIETSKETYAYIRNKLGTGIEDSATFLNSYREQQHKILNLINNLNGVTFLLLHKDSMPEFPQMKAALEAIDCRCKESALIVRRFGELQQDNEREGTICGVQIVDDSAFLIPSQTGSVLVVDDEPIHRKVLMDVLDQYGFTAHEESNGRDAIERLKSGLAAKQYFDLVILDLLMRDITGFEVLEFMKKNPDLASIPVIIVSGLNQPKLIAQCIKFGAADFLTKPVDNYLLLSRINACMEKQLLREKEFGQFFPPRLAKEFARNPRMSDLAQDVEVSILFADIRKFSAISERLNANDAMHWLGDVLGCLSDCIQRNDGVVLDYIGDEVLGMWGAPDDDPQHADRACKAAMEMLEALPAMVDHKWRHVIPDGTKIGIGINSGIARVGNTGSGTRFKYGANGPTVNLASRIQGATKYLRTPFVISEQTKNLLSEDFVPRRLCSVQVVNVEEPVVLYELVSESNSGSKTSIIKQYENALQLFENQKLSKATSALAELLSEFPNDGPSILLMSKIMEVLVNNHTTVSPVIKLPGK